jgi:hypothetical protein
MRLAEEIDAGVGAAKPATYRAKEYLLETGARHLPAQGEPSTVPVGSSLLEFREFVAKIESQVSQPLRVLMDTTTIWTAKELVSGNTGELTPNTLLDLDTFVRNVVLYDCIFHLPNPELDPYEINEHIGEPVVIKLPVSELGLQSVLFDIWYLAKETLHDKMLMGKRGTSAIDDFRAIETGWRQVLGDVLKTPLTGGELFDIHNYMHFWSASSASQLARQLRKISLGEKLTYRPENVKTFRHFVVQFVGETNLRAAFNLLLADSIGLPYSPNLARLPFYYHLFRNAKVTHEKLRDVQIIQAELREEFARSMAGLSDAIQLPVLLTAILSRIDSLKQFWDKLKQLRSSATPYRRRRAELLEALRKGASKDVDKLRRAVRDDAKAWKKKLASTAVLKGLPMASAFTVAPILGGGLAPQILATVAAVAAIVKGGDLNAQARATIARRFRPQEWFLTDVGTSARGLLDAFEKVDELWNPGWDLRRRYKARLQQLAGLSEAWEPLIMDIRFPAGPQPNSS